MSTLWYPILQNARLIWPTLNLHILTCHHANPNRSNLDPPNLSKSNHTNINPSTSYPIVNSNVVNPNQDPDPCTSNRLEKLLILEIDTSNNIKNVLLQTPWLENALSHLHSILCELAGEKVIREGLVVPPTRAAGVATGVGRTDGASPATGVGPPACGSPATLGTGLLMFGTSSNAHPLISNPIDRARNSPPATPHPLIPRSPTRSLKERAEAAATNPDNLFNAASIQQDPAYFLHITQEIVAEEGLGDFEETAFHEDMDEEFEVLRRREGSAAQRSLLRNLQLGGGDDTGERETYGGKDGKKAVRIERWNDDVENAPSGGVVQEGAQGAHRNALGVPQGMQNRTAGLETKGSWLKQYHIGNSPLLGTSGSPLETYAGSGTSEGWPSVRKRSPFPGALEGLKSPIGSKQNPVVVQGNPKNARNASQNARNVSNNARNASQDPATVRAPVKIKEQKWFGEHDGENIKTEDLGLGITVSGTGIVVRRTYDGGHGFITQGGEEEEKVAGTWAVSEGG